MISLPGWVSRRKEGREESWREEWRDKRKVEGVQAVLLQSFTSTVSGSSSEQQQENDKMEGNKR